MPEEEAVLSHVKAIARQGDPESVIQAIDQFAEDNYFLIHIGRTKRRKIEQLMQEATVSTVLELGTNFGYSAIVMARFLKSRQGQIVTVEISNKMARTAAKMIQYAGLSDRIRILMGDASKIIPKLDRPFDMVFLDHEKDRYLPDLKLIERHRLIQTNAIVLADNTGMYRYALKPYLNHVKSSGKYVSHTIDGDSGFETRISDAMELSIYLGAERLPKGTA